MTSSGHVLWLMLVGVITWTPAASADTAATDKAVAETLFREGRELLEAGKTEQACAKFAESDRFDASAGTMLNLADCHARIGRTASAWAEFNETAQRARGRGQHERANYATRRAAELESKLSRISLQVAAPQRVRELKLDGKALGPSGWTAALPLDPGQHEVTVVWSDGQTTRHSISVPNKPGKFVTPIQAPAARAQLAPKADSDSTDGAGTTRIIAWSALGVGAAGVAVGSYFGLKAIGLKNDSDEDCDASGCGPDALDSYERAGDAATVSTVAFGVGAALAALGVGLLTFEPTADRAGARVMIGSSF